MDNNDSYLDPKSVRMFYCLILKHVIPKSSMICSTEKNCGDLPDKQPEVDFCESLNFQLESLLEPHGFQISFDKEVGVRPCKKKQLTYFIPFLVSKVYEFKAEDIIIPRPYYTGFKVKPMALSSVQDKFAQDILDRLNTKVVIHELVFSIATSRSFVFKIYYEGSFRIRREFSDYDIEAECGVKNALETFFYEIESAIKPFGFAITSTPSRHRRSRNNEYLFGVYYAPCIGFSESDVLGEGCFAIRGDSSINEVNDYGVDFDATMVDDFNELLNSTLEENLPPYADLISSEIEYIDSPEEAIVVCDELISN